MNANICMLIVSFPTTPLVIKTVYALNVLDSRVTVRLKVSDAGLTGTWVATIDSQAYARQSTWL
jgi:hypothetical protein